MEKETIIQVNHVTKDYGRNRGIFDIAFEIHKGEVFGYCGTNGSGKTTTIRTIMGFVKPDIGTVLVNGMDAWKDSEAIKSLIGYVPGEINFPDVYSGTDFLKIQASLIHLKDMTLAEQVINTMQLDPTANLKRMSKGMKQKTAIVNSMMNMPEILIFDEPTTGLDPLMRKSFIDLVMEAKKLGRTIFMSSHMFNELEETCDRVGLIYNGRLIDIVDIKKLKNRPKKEYEISFKTKKDFEEYKKITSFKIKEENTKYNELIVEVKNTDLTQFFKELKKYELVYILEKKYTLENYFLEAIGGKENGTSATK